MTDHTIAAIIYEAMLWGNDQPKRPNSLIAYAPFGNSDAEVEARRFADRIVDLRGAIEPQPDPAAIREAALRDAGYDTPTDPRDAVIARLVEALVRSLTETRPSTAQRLMQALAARLPTPPSQQHCGAEMSKLPHNAGQTIEIEHLIHGPVSTVDFGKITVTENWGRLFIKQGDSNEVVIERGAYVALRDAIDHFIKQKTPPDLSIDEMAYLFWSIHPRDIPDPIGMPERYPGGARAWFYATEIRKVVQTLTDALRVLSTIQVFGNVEFWGEDASKTSAGREILARMEFAKRVLAQVEKNEVLK